MDVRHRLPAQDLSDTVSIADFAPWLSLWRLEPDGEPFVTTFRSRLLPVLADGAPAMLKLAGSEEERRGGALMTWYAGDGAARVFAAEREALLLERAMGERSLVTMAGAGEDEEAMRILCSAAGRLHAPRRTAPPASLVPLDVWFRALPEAASKHGGVFVASWEAARALLAAPHEVTPLHGDLHHGNVLDGGERGWLAIDPKGLLGERGFDYANMACNPDIEIAGAPGAFARRTRIICAEAGLAPELFLAWVLAWAGLSAAWTLDDGGDARPALEMARLAARELGKG